MSMNISQSGITSSLLSIELGYSQTQINIVIDTSVGAHCGLFLRKCNTLDKTNTDFRRTA